MSTTDSAIKALWVALCIMLALLVGVAAGILSWLGGQHPPGAILIGGGAFGGTVTVALLIMNALKLRPTGRPVARMRSSPTEVVGYRG